MEWKKDLYQYQDTPPPRVWENICTELDADIPAVRKVLYDLEETPPAPVWASIVSELDMKNPEAPVIWYRRPLFAGAAAAALAAIVFVSTYLNKQQGVDLSASVYKPAVESLQQQPAQIPAPSAQVDILNTPAPFDQSVSPSPGPSLPPDARDLTTYSMRDAQVDRNYIYFTTTTGELKRASYKFERMITEMKDQDSERMKKWREKLAGSTLIPTAGNFFDIAEMARLLEEK